LKTVELIAKRDGFKIDKTKVGAVFKTSHFPGRFDVKKIKDKTVVFDGAHNPQKMEAFTEALKDKFPKEKFHFLIAFKKGKDYQGMLRYIIPLAAKITITSFFIDNQDLVHLSEKPEEIGKVLEIRKFRNYEIIVDPKKAFEAVLKAKDKTVVVTGSLYLLGEIYRSMSNYK